jgi:hypothetical protein
MRKCPPYYVLCLVLAILPTACVTRTWRDLALAERPDFGSPALAFETFRAAVRLDKPMLGYRAISEEMKEREGFTEIMFISGWNAFFDRHPLARLAGNAEIVDMKEVSKRFARIRAKSHGTEIVTSWIRRDYYEIRAAGSLIIDGYVDDLHRLIQKDSKAPGSLEARIADMRIGDLDPATVEQLHVGSEWKLLELDTKDARERP